MRILKKIGRFGLTLLPFLLLALAQFLFLFGASLFFALRQPGATGLSLLELFYTGTIELNKHPVPVLLLFQLFYLLIFAPWYLFIRKRTGPHHPIRLGRRGLAALCGMGILLQLLLGILLTLLAPFAPRVFEQYNALIENSGVAEFGLLPLLATSIAAPLGEEIVFRGLTLHFAQKFTRRFWLANTLQALLFGIFHGNLVQGVYAFCLGLLLGWLYSLFHIIGPCILLHCVFNASSLLADLYFSLFPEAWGVWVLAAHLLLCIPGLFFAARTLKRAALDKPPAKG